MHFLLIKLRGVIDGTKVHSEHDFNRSVNTPSRAVNVNSLTNKSNVDSRKTQSNQRIAICLSNQKKQFEIR